MEVLNKIGTANNAICSIGNEQFNLIVELGMISTIKDGDQIIFKTDQTVIALDDCFNDDGTI